MNCRDAGELFSPSLDQQLDREEELGLQAHLESCLACRLEWSEWKRVADALRQLKHEEMAAPAGFSTAVMARIESEKARPASVDWKRWKQAAIGTAAALMLAFGSLAIRADHFMQVANQDKQVNQIQGSQPQVGTNTNIQTGKSAVTTPGGNEQKPAVQQPGSTDTSQNTPAVRPSSQIIPSTAQFTSNHLIISTLLKVKVDNDQNSETAAIKLAQASGASVQSLGQQSEGEALYLVDKIVVEEPQAPQLIKNLANLGTTISKEDQKIDLTKRYSDMYAQWITLKNQRSQTQDSVQAANLDQQIGQVEEQLRSWDKQTSQQTIVLWLQQ